MDENLIKIGSTINHLTIKSYINSPKDKTKYKNYPGPWVRCECSCGAEVIAPLYGIKRGLIKSCGHYKGEQGGKVLRKYYKDHDPSNTIYLTFNDETRNISEWSRMTGIPRTTILYRINKGMPLSKVFRKGEKDD